MLDTPMFESVENVNKFVMLHRNDVMIVTDFWIP